jgi:hypothetical protein
MKRSTAWGNFTERKGEIDEECSEINDECSSWNWNRKHLLVAILYSLYTNKNSCSSITFRKREDAKKRWKVID